MDFKDKVCVVTGGANGIGLAIIRKFSKAGAKVAFIDIDGESGERALLDIKKSGGDGLFFCGDIAEETVLRNFRNRVIEAYGKIDYLINNACLSRSGILSGCSYDDFNYVLRVGVTAPYMLSYLFLDYFNPGASIVNISSTRAFMSQADTESYTAAKGGITALTHALSVSLAGRARVNSISPGWIDVSANFDPNYEDNHSLSHKRQHPAQRVGRPKDIVRTVMFLCSKDSDFITGENITVDGGMTRLMIYHGDDGWNYSPR